MKALALAVAVAAGFSLAGAAQAQDAAKTAEAAGCMKCHDVEKKKMGPSLKSVAAKYKGTKDAEATLVGKLKAGTGHPKASAADADLQAITKWILAM